LKVDAVEVLVITSSLVMPFKVFIMDITIAASWDSANILVRVIIVVHMGVGSLTRVVDIVAFVATTALVVAQTTIVTSTVVINT
jgi:hypothetical protein